MLTLCPLTHAHTLDVYLSSNNDKDIRHYMPGCYCDTYEKATEFITNKLADHTVQTYIIATNKHPFIGLLIISEQGKDLSNGKNCYEISYFIKNTDTEIPYRKIWLNVFDSDLEQYGYAARGMIWRYQDATASVRANADGSLVYTTAGSWGAGLQIAPAYELSYYTALQQNGYKSLTFDMKLDVKYCEGVSEAIKATTFKVMSFGGAGIEYQSGETHTVTVSLANIITYYKELQNVALGTNPDTDWFGKYVLFYLSYNDQEYSPNNHENLTFTLGNFQMVK
jgi:hypothetical protein